MKKILILSFAALSTSSTRSQSFAINTDGSTANSSSILDVKSTTKGMLIPRVTKTQKNAIATPANGLLVYQTGPDSIGFYYYQSNQWNWITDNKKSDSAYWGLHGNSNTNPPSSANNGPIDYANDTYLGTFDAKDVSMLSGGNELMRLKQFATGGRIGLSNRSPEYSLDLRITEIAPETPIRGMRIIAKELFDINSTNNINKGLVIGNSATNPDETVIWNHANNINGIMRIGFDQFNSTIRPAITINQYGEGIYQRNPKYALDIHSQSQFAPATTSTSKNGVRVTYQNQQDQNTEERGLFIGVGVNNLFKSYLWNYTDGPASNSPDKAIYLGVGSDMDLSSNKASMEIQNGKIIMGSITDPNFFFPGTLNIQTNYASGVAKNGMSVMQLLSTQESAYFGVDDNNNLNVYKYGTGDILLGINNTNYVSIKPTGNVGIGTSTPFDKLHVAGNIRSTPLAGVGTRLASVDPNGTFTNIAAGSNDQILTMVAGTPTWSGNTNWSTLGNTGTSAATNFLGTTDASDLAIRTSNTEAMRVTAGGNVGIGTASPHALLQFSNSVVNRKIILYEGANNDHQYYGFGINGATLRYQADATNSDHVFFAAASAISSNELMRIKGTGNVGIGTSTPIKQTEIVGAASAIPVTLVIGNRGGFGPSAMEFVSDYGLASQWRPGYIRSNDQGGFTGTLEFYTNGAGAGNLYGSVKGFEVRNGAALTATGTVGTFSDERLKKNIRSFTDGLNVIVRINPVQFQYNELSPFKTDDTQIGILAQQLEKVAPYMVHNTKEKNIEDLRWVNNQAYIYLLINSVKELQKQILQQQKQIDQLLKNKQ